MNNILRRLMLFAFASTLLICCTATALAKHCPGNDISDCERAAETARNPWVPFAGAVAGAGAGWVVRRTTTSSAVIRGRSQSSTEVKTMAGAVDELQENEEELYPECDMERVRFLEGQIAQLTDRINLIKQLNQPLYQQLSELKKKRVALRGHVFGLQSALPDLRDFLRRQRELLKKAEENWNAAILTRWARYTAVVTSPAAYATTLATFALGGLGIASLLDVFSPHEAEWLNLVRSLRRSISRLERQIKEINEQIEKLPQEIKNLLEQESPLWEKIYENDSKLELLRQKRQVIWDQLRPERIKCGIPVTD